MTWLDGWDKRIKLTIDHSKVDAALTWFPVMVHLSASCGLGSGDMSRVFDELVAEKLKLAVTSDDGVTELYVEVEKWDNAGEEAILWVSKTGWSVSDTEDTVLYLYYDADHADNTTYVGAPNSAAAEAVWDSNFQLVDHMQDDPDTSHTRDSTANDYDGTKKGAAEPAESASGKAGDAQNLDGADDYIGYGNQANFNFTDKLTIECLVKPSTLASANGSAMMLGKVDNYYFGFQKTTGMLRGRVYPEAEQTAAQGALEAGVWAYCALVYDRSNVVFYKDGVAVKTYAQTGDIGTGVHALNAGVDSPGGGAGAFWFPGLIDEMRLSSTNRAAAWLKANNYNQLDQLVTFSIEATTLPDVRVRIAFDSDPLDASLTWSDVSGDVREAHTSRGRNHELDRMEAGTAVIVLTNLDGDYWPDNAGGAYYGDVKVMKPVDIQAIWDGTIYPAFRGFIESWTPGWLGEGGYGAVMTLNCVDGLKVLSLQVVNDGTGYSAEASGTRAGNVLDDASWPAAKRDIDAGDETMQATGALENENALNHLQLVQESELSLLYVAPDGDIQYEDRSHRTASPHDTSQATFGPGVGEHRYADLKYVLDDALLYNEVRMTRTGGSEQVSTNAASQTAYGKRSLVRSGLLNNSDIGTELLSDYLVARYADVVGRVESIKIVPGNDAGRWLQVMTREISDRITIKKTEAGLDKEYFIERVQNDWNIVTGEYSTVYMVSDASQYFYEPDAKDETLRPASGGGTLTRNTGASNWEAVDEITPDNDTTYVYCNPSEPYDWQADAYGLPSSSYGIGTINSVKVYALCRSSKVAGLQGTAKVGVNGTYGDSNSLSGTDWHLISTTWNTNPATGVAWTWANITDLSAYIALYPPLTAGNKDGDARCTQVYVVVNFTPNW